MAQEALWLFSQDKSGVGCFTMILSMIGVRRGVHSRGTFARLHISFLGRTRRDDRDRSLVRKNARIGPVFGVNVSFNIRDGLRIAADYGSPEVNRFQARETRLVAEKSPRGNQGMIPRDVSVS